jgi:hypothetical protein
MGLESIDFNRISHLVDFIHHFHYFFNHLKFIAINKIFRFH